ncbi:MAG: tRNA (N6-isopentenyl adenosine(37)-C2)-methylthiotransferase MiaB [Candidatus Marinimicrobia bacterium]|nr:tRNA (N6-isopentenyl adenosine(37)-C2)-methylthiotransferase MiaB [Candidatus Neomarinimicrobiota bacterium]
MYYYLETYGCQMNVADSEWVAGLLDKSGYRRTQRLEDAKIILINTCAIREKAEETVHSRLGRLAELKQKDPSILIGVLGCMAKNLADSLLESKPYVDLVLGPDSYRRLPEIIRQRQAGRGRSVDTQLSRFEVYDDLFPTRQSGVNAWLSIMRGCDKFCTFCVVPFTRGRERSRSVESLLAEAEDAIDQGFVELTLLGQNVNSYRHGEARFPDLLTAIAAVEGVRRIRYTSPHPSDIDRRLLDVMAAHPNICKSIHLPLQSGADRILRRMNRTYTQGEYLALVARIREVLPDCSLSTDIIVGFPGETEGEFLATLEVMEQVKFDSAFTFKYSVRPGTKAAEYHDQVPEEVKQARLKRLLELQKPISLRRNRAYVGRIVEVLVEKESKKSDRQWAGRTDSNKWVVFDKECARIKDFVDVHIDSSYGVALKGHLVAPSEAYHAVA